MNDLKEQSIASLETVIVNRESSLESELHKVLFQSHFYLSTFSVVVEIEFQN